MEQPEFWLLAPAALPPGPRSPVFPDNLFSPLIQFPGNHLSSGSRVLREGISKNGKATSPFPPSREESLLFKVKRVGFNIPKP